METIAKKDVPVQMSIKFAMDYAKEIQEAFQNQLQRKSIVNLNNSNDPNWVHPSADDMKMTVDGSAKLGRRSDIGGLIRNNRGEWVSGFAENIHACGSLEAEIQAIHTGLTLLKTYKWKKVMIETDSLKAKKMIHARESRITP